MLSTLQAGVTAVPATPAVLCVALWRIIITRRPPDSCDHDSCRGLQKRRLRVPAKDLATLPECNVQVAQIQCVGLIAV